MCSFEQGEHAELAAEDDIGERLPARASASTRVMIAAPEICTLVALTPGYAFHEAVGERLHGADIHVGVDDRFTFGLGALQQFLLAFRRRQFLQHGELGIDALRV